MALKSQCFLPDGTSCTWALWELPQPSAATQCPKEIQNTREEHASTAGTSVSDSIWTSHKSSSLSITKTSWCKTKNPDFYIYPITFRNTKIRIWFCFYFWRPAQNKVWEVWEMHGAMVTSDIRSLTEQTSCRNDFCVKKKLLNYVSCVKCDAIWFHRCRMKFMFSLSVCKLFSKYLFALLSSHTAFLLTAPITSALHYQEMDWYGSWL